MIQTAVVIRKEDALDIESSTGPILQNSFLITDRNKVDQELDHVSKRSRFHETQKDQLPITGVEDPVDSELMNDHLHQAAWSRHSSRSYVTNKLKGRPVGSVLQWCHYLAWALCLLLSLSCLVLSAVLGLR